MNIQFRGPKKREVVLRPKLTLEQQLRERRYIVFSALAWVTVVLLVVMVMIPRFQAMLAIRGENARHQTTLDGLRAKLQFLETFRNEDFDRLNDRVEAILPSQKPFLQMLSSLEQLAVQEQVAFAGLDVNPGVIASTSSQITEREARDGLSTLDLKLSILGSSEQLNNFIARMNNLAPALDVRTFVLIPRDRSSSASPSAGIYEADIELSSLFAPILINIDASRTLPRLSQEENEYVNQGLLEYTIFDRPLVLPGQLVPTGKTDPFTLN